MRWLVILAACSCALAIIPAPGEGVRERMERAALAFLGSLDADQRARAVLAFEERERWHFIPADRPGITLGEMTDAQQRLAHALLRSGLSRAGYLKTEAIIQLEHVLREMGQDPAFRDPDKYVIQVFAEPGPGTPWGWRIEGHHLSILFTFGGGPEAGVTPFFMGANPGEVERGSRAGLRVLAVEEDAARELLASLSSAQHKSGVMETEVPRDVLMGPGQGREVLGERRGLAWADMNESQHAILRRLIGEYLGNLSHDVAEAQRQRMGDLTDVAFLWIGGDERRQPHYYRIHAKRWVIEYDNTQDGANHPHVLFRDFERDFGRDLLGEHLERDHAR